MTPPKGACMWCRHSDRPWSNEHIIGKQIVDRLGPGATYPIHMHIQGWVGRAKEQLAVVLPSRNQRVCKTCNNGWMREIDDAFVAIVGDAMTSGDNLHLTTSMQKVIATWAVKVSLLTMVMLSDFKETRPDLPGNLDDYYVPTDNLQYVRKHRKPPKTTQVWMGATELRTPAVPFASQLGAIGTRVFAGPDPNPVRQERAGYVATFVLNRMVFKVVGTRSHFPRGSGDAWKPAPLELPDDFHDGVRSIWRAEGLFTWPSSLATLSPEGLGALAHSEFPLRLLDEFTS